MIVINIAPLTEELFCNWPLLKDISFNHAFNTKCLLVWCDEPAITCLVRATFRISHPCDFWKFWDCPHFFYSGNFKVAKMHSGNLSLITLLNMRLLVLTAKLKQRKREEVEATPLRFSQLFWATWLKTTNVIL